MKEITCLYVFVVFVCGHSMWQRSTIVALSGRFIKYPLNFSVWYLSSYFFNICLENIASVVFHCFRNAVTLWPRFRRVLSSFYFCGPRTGLREQRNRDNVHGVL